jgi:hypothetical protein
MAWMWRFAMQQEFVSARATKFAPKRSSSALDVGSYGWAENRHKVALSGA